MQRMEGLFFNKQDSSYSFHFKMVLLQVSWMKYRLAVQQNKSFLIKLREKWGLKSLFQVIMVLIVFSLTGMSVVLIRPLLFTWFGFTEETSIWIKTITYLLLIFPMYQVLILFYGALLGQFSFFWEKEKKLVEAICSPFRKKGKK